MLAYKNQSYWWKIKSEKKLPTIDFLNPLTLESYGNLRRIIRDYG